MSNNCSAHCFYFPDMTVKPGEWEYDEKLPYIKRRKEKKVFRCGYDNHILDWKVECPIEHPVQNITINNE